MLINLKKVLQTEIKEITNEKIDDIYEKWRLDIEKKFM